MVRVTATVASSHKRRLFEIEMLHQKKEEEQECDFIACYTDKSVLFSPLKLCQQSDTLPFLGNVCMQIQMLII